MGLRQPQRQSCTDTGQSHFAEGCFTVGVMYDLKSHLRAHVTWLILHYCDSFPYMESGATVMYGPLMLPKLWLSSLTRASYPDLWPDNQTFETCTVLLQSFSRKDELVFFHLVYGNFVVVINLVILKYSFVTLLQYRHSTPIVVPMSNYHIYMWLTPQQMNNSTWLFMVVCSSRPFSSLYPNL